MTAFVDATAGIILLTTPATFKKINHPAETRVKIRKKYWLQRSPDTDRD